MKTWGILMAVVAMIALVLSLLMNVDVNGINNIGLIADRHNYLTASCTLLIAAFILIGFGSKSTNAGDEKKCPFCSESIKQKAVDCRFCGKTLPAYGQTQYPFTMEGLSLAIKAGDVANVSKILNSNPEFINKDYFGDFPLHIAASSGHVEVCKKLLQLGANTKNKDVLGRYASDIAKERGFIEITSFLAYSY